MVLFYNEHVVYVALLRGINVGGNNKISMAVLKACVEELGYKKVRTYINSGNVLFRSNESASKIALRIEAVLAANFPHTTIPIKVLVISQEQLEEIIDKAPEGFGQSPANYHSDVLFLIGVSPAKVMEQTETNPDVDRAWLGAGVIYYQRLSAERTKSRLSKLAGKPIYKSITIRSWNTVRKLATLMREY